MIYWEEYWNSEEQEFWEGPKVEEPQKDISKLETIAIMLAENYRAQDIIESLMKAFQIQASVVANSPCADEYQKFVEVAKMEGLAFKLSKTI